MKAKVGWRLFERMLDWQVFAALALAGLAAVLVPASAQSITVKDAGGRILQLDEVIDAGQELTVEYQIPPNIYYKTYSSLDSGLLGSDRYISVGDADSSAPFMARTYDDPRTVTQTVEIKGAALTPAAQRISFGLLLSETGETDASDPGYNYNDRKYDQVGVTLFHDVWIVNQIGVSNAGMSLSAPNAEGESELSFSLREADFAPAFNSYGRVTDENRAWFSLYWWRPGGTAPDGSTWTMSEASAISTPDFVAGSNRFPIRQPRYPGKYHLILSRDGWIIDHLDVDVPVPAPFDNAGTTDFGYWADHGVNIDASSKLNVTQGERAELRIYQIDREAPVTSGDPLISSDYDEELDPFGGLTMGGSEYVISILNPTTSYQKCVADGSELDTVWKESIQADHVGFLDIGVPGLMQMNLPTGFLRPGTYQFAISGVNSTFEGVTSQPILTMGLLDVKPKAVLSSFSVENAPNREVDGRSVPSARLNVREISDIIFEPPVWKNASGAVQVYSFSEPETYEPGQDTSAYRADLGLQASAVGAKFCLNSASNTEGCFYEVTHRDPTVGSTAGRTGFIPQAVFRRLSLERAPTLQQTWPIRAPRAQQCGAVAAPSGNPEEDTYAPPPVMAMHLYSEPKLPTAGTTTKYALRVENKGKTTASGLKVRLKLTDSRSKDTLEDFAFDEDQCTLLESKALECDLGSVAAGEHSDIFLSGSHPDSGQAHWEAALKSSGDLGGKTTGGGVVGILKQPTIHTAFVDTDQLAIFEGGEPAYRHPSGDRNAMTWRRIFVVGKGLSDLQVWRQLPSDDPRVRYHVDSRTGLSGPLYTPQLVRAWKHYYKMEDGQAALARAREEKLEGVVVSAHYSDDVLPGDKSFKIDGVKVDWTLQFGDVAANVQFVRKLGQRYEAMDHAFSPEFVHVRAVLSHKLPLTEIKAQITRPHPDTGKAVNETVLLTPLEGTNNRVFLSKPIEIHPAGQRQPNSDAKSIVFKMDDKRQMSLKVRLEPTFAKESLAVAAGAIETEIIVKSSPGRGTYSYLWTDALGKAVSCHPELMQTRLDRASSEVSEEFTNYFFIVGKGWSQTQEAKIGHHAATVLLRDKYLEISKAVDEGLKKGLTDDASLIDYHVRLARQQYSQLENPIYDLKVKGENGEEIRFSQALVSSRSYIDQRSFFRTQVTSMEEWRKEATRSVIRQQLAASAETREEAEELGSCEIEDLLKFTGHSFGPVVERLKPELMTIVTRENNGQFSTIWLEDVSARAWVDLVGVLAADLKRQQSQAQTDTSIALAIAGIVAMPLAFAETGSVFWYATLAFDAVDVGLNTWHELRQYWQSEQELVYARGAINVLGHQRFNDAVRSQYSLLNVSMGIGMSALGAIGNAPDIVQVYRARQGYKIAESLRTANGIAELNESQTTYLLTYAAMTSAKRTSRGVEALTATERKLLDWMDGASEAQPLRVSLQDPAEYARAQALARGDYEIPSTRPSFDQPPVPRALDDVADAADAVNATSARIPTQKISYKGPTGEDLSISVGPKIDSGASSEVFQHPQYRDRVIRITYKRDAPVPDVLDTYGERVLSNVDSDHLRGAKIHEELSLGTNEDILRVTVVEKLEPAYGTIDNQWGKIGSFGAEARLNANMDMSIAQAEAYVGAMEDLNRRGFVWLDNKPDNFAFVPKNDGSGAVDVVVMDAGGIFPISADAAARRGMSQAELASEIQQHANGSFQRFFPSYSGADDIMARTRHRQMMIGQRYSDAFDYPEIGIRGPHQLAFMPYAGEGFPYLGPFFDHADIGSELLETQRFRTFVPPPARDTGFGEVLGLTETRKFEDFAPPGSYDSSLLNTRRFEEISPPGNVDSALPSPRQTPPRDNNPFGGLSDASASNAPIRAPPEGLSDFHVSPNTAPPGGPRRQVRVVDESGTELDLRFDTRTAGQGSYNTVVGYGNDRVMRLPFGRTEEGAELARIADHGGRKLVDEAFDGVPDADLDVKLVTLHSEFKLASDTGIPSLGPGMSVGFMDAGDTVQILQFKEPFSKSLGAADRPAAFRNAMTDAEALAFDQAHRALNENGIVWLDNKFDNFAFEPHPNPKFPGQQRLVILDTGGLVAMKGRNAELAARLQSYTNGAAPEAFRKGYMEVQEGFRWQTKALLLKNEFGSQLDMASIGLKPENLDDFSFNPMSVEDFGKARALSELSPDEARAFAATYGRYRQAGRTREVRD